MPRTAPNYFVVSGLEPADPSWASASVSQRAAYLRVVRVLVLTEWDAQTAAGLDRFGNPMAKLSERTIKHRKSAMGPADPNAPPLQPAHELSRTRSLVDARVQGTAIRVYWKFDPVSGKRWGTILGYHRDGKGRLPVRDVMGLSPAAHTRVVHQANLWWSAYSRGLPSRMPTRPRPGKAAKRLTAELPRYQPVGSVKPKPATAPAPRPSKVVDLAIGGDVYTMTRTSAKELMGAIGRGQFTGFRSYAGGKPSPVGTGTGTVPRPALAKALAAKPAAPKTHFEWSRAVDRQLPAFRAQTANLQEERDRFWVRLATAADTTDDALKARFAEGLKATVEASEPYIRAESDVLAKVLDAGRFKSQFETGTSRGTYSPEVRRYTEAHVMGVPETLPDRERPIYGYLGEKDFGGFHGAGEAWVNEYGEASIKLKRSTLDRSTLTIGDSLAKGDQLQASRALEPSAESLSVALPRSATVSTAAVTRTPTPERSLHNLRTLQSEYHYVELQFHGGLVASEIEEVAFPSQPAAELVTLLEQRGILWRVIKPKSPFSGIPGALD